ncbi:MAG: hypothetical protein KKA07_05775 [Bacteroidetes bacterium]|nr:hypothetical protein [Bacteroidota bacterium]MBU1718563.1 hypothetical protein [Bacteroidota bacterium]
MNSYSYEIGGISLDIFSPKCHVIHSEPFFSHRIVSAIEQPFNISIINSGLPETHSLECLADIEAQSPGFSITRWKVFKSGNDYLVEIPKHFDNQKMILKVATGSKNWELFVSDDCIEINPFSHPLGSLLQYFMVSESGGILIHAGGVEFQGKGILFAGVSGKGKSTITRLFVDAGAKLIHDDRIILLKKEQEFHMHTSPVHPGDMPASAIVNEIFLIDHGQQNHAISLCGAAANVGILGNCIQHNYDRYYAERRLDIITDLTQKTHITKLRFLPDSSVVDFIRKTHLSND